MFFLLIFLLVLTFLELASISVLPTFSANPVKSPALQELKQQRSRGRTPSTRRPVVDRKTIIDMIVEEDQEEEETSTVTDIVNMRWPPLVTAVPEVHPSSDATRIGLSTNLVDSQFCRGQTQCRLLLPLWIGEQESKGRIHFAQVLHLAAALNRTIVLPNVGKSRLGACGKWGFEAYYDVGSVARQFKDMTNGDGQIMFLDDFRTWVGMRPESPVGQLVFFDERAASHADHAQATLARSEGGLDLYVDDNTLEATDIRLKNSFCLKTKMRHLRLDSLRPLSVHANISDATAASSPGNTLSTLIRRPDVLHMAATGQALQDLTLLQDTDNAGSSASKAEPEVLVAHWDLRHLPFLSPTTTLSFNYSHKLWELSDLLTNPSRPYLAVHWRMETVQPDLLPDCAEALVDTLGILLAEPTLARDIKTVWLATDMPLPLSSDEMLHAPPQRSNTFKTVTNEHTLALNIVKDAFDLGGSLENWKMTNLAEQMYRVRKDLAQRGRDFSLVDEDDSGLIWEDTGVWGILDKMAAMQSTLFVSGARGCGRVRYVALLFTSL